MNILVNEDNIMSTGKIYKLSSIDDITHVVDAETSRTTVVPMDDVLRLVALFLNSNASIGTKASRFTLLRNISDSVTLNPIHNIEEAIDSMVNEDSKIQDCYYDAIGVETLSYINVCMWANSMSNNVYKGKLHSFIQSQVSKPGREEYVQIPVTVLKECVVDTLRYNEEDYVLEGPLKSFVLAVFEVLKEHFSTMDKDVRC